MERWNAKGISGRSVVEGWDKGVGDFGERVFGKPAFQTTEIVFEWIFVKLFRFFKRKTGRNIGISYKATLP